LIHINRSKVFSASIVCVFKRREIMRKAALVLGIVAAALGASVAAARAPTANERGQAFAQRHCATCHAIGRTGLSPYAPAPPFRTLHERYPVEMLAEALAEGIVVGHTGVRQMPAFRLEPGEIDDLIGYLKSLEAH
jgi:mono/diheme cytochrome c family protein